MMLSEFELKPSQLMLDVNTSFLSSKDSYDDGSSYAGNSGLEATDSFTLGSFTAHQSPGVKHEPLEKIIHYLSKMPLNENQVSSEIYEEHMKNLSEIVLQCVKVYKDPSFIRIIKAYGWIGQRFSSDHRMFDRNNLLQAISNLYLKFQYKMSESLENIVDIHSKSSNSEVNHLEKIAAFCPDIVLDYVSNNASSFFGNSDNPPPSFTFVGACMLVDISGFSKFSASMCSKGISGLDELRKATSGLLGQFVKEVYEHDGDVVAFAGDALICIFTDNKHRKSANESLYEKGKSLHKVDACFRALHCANILRSVHFVELSTHIGISYGEMKMAFLGGHNGQWVYLMNGKCLSQLSSCLDDASSQMVVVTEDCYDHLISLYEIVESPSISKKEISVIIDTDDITFDEKDEDDFSDNDSPSNIKFLRNMSPTPRTYIDYPRITMNKIEKTGNYQLATLVESAEFNNLLNIMGRLGFIAAIKAGSTPRAGASFHKMKRKKSTRTLSLHKLSMDELYDSARLEMNMKKRKIVEALTLFIPIPVMSALRTESNHQLGELRTVTTMFLCLDSYSPEKYHDPQSLQPFFLIAQKALSDTGGFLRQFLVDDKGCVLIAMWGMPSYTYANNCSRALYCAHLIRKQTKDISIECSIGITTGTVFCGTIGAAERCDYVGIGTEVNLAARFMAKAHGNIFVDEATYGNLNEENRSLLTVGEELVLKGMPAPIRPYVYSSSNCPLLENIDAKTREKKSKLLKKKVMQLLEKQLDLIANTLSSGTPRKTYKTMPKTPRKKSKKVLDFQLNNVNFTILCGQPGSGKSTAVEYFQISARERGIQIIHIRAQSYHRNIPYGIMKEIFLELVGQENFESPFQQKRILDALFQEAFMEENPGDENSGYYDEKQLLEMRAAVEMLLGVDTSLASNQQDDQTENALTKEITEGGTPIHLSKYGEVFLTLAPKNRLNVTTPFKLRRDDETSSNDSKGRSDLSFYKLMAVLLQNTPTALVIENAHFCDELTWNELLLILVGFDLEMSVLLTMKSQHYQQNNNVANNNSSPTPTTGAMRMSNRSRNNSFTNLIDATSVPSQQLVTQTSLSSQPSPLLHSLSQQQNRPVSFHPSSSFVNHFPVRVQTRMDMNSNSEEDIGESNNASTPSSTEARLQSFGLSFIDVPAFHAITAHASCTIYEMKSLGEDDVRAMLIHHLKVDSVSNQLVKLVSDVSSGNSYWCKMIAQFIKDQGVAHLEKAIQSQYDMMDNSSIIMTSIIPIEFNAYSSPSSIKQGSGRQHQLTGPQTALRSLILCRMEALSAEHKTLLKYISVVGSEFTIPLIESILPQTFLQELSKASSETTLHDILEALEKHCFIHCVSEYPTFIYAFQNELIQRTIYELLPPSDAAEIHISIAKYLEQEFTTALRPFYPSLAYHYRLGKDKERSFKYEIKAAALAVSSGAYNDGLALTEKALQLVEFPAQLSVVMEVTDRAIDDLKIAENPNFFSRFSQSFYSFMSRGGTKSFDAMDLSTGTYHPSSPAPNKPKNTALLLQSKLFNSNNANNSNSSNFVNPNYIPAVDEKMEFSVSFSKKQNSVHQANIAAFRVLRTKAEQIQKMLVDGFSLAKALSTTLSIQIPDDSTMTPLSANSPAQGKNLTPINGGAYRLNTDDSDSNSDIESNLAMKKKSRHFSKNSNASTSRVSIEARAELMKMHTTTKKLSWQPSFMERSSTTTKEDLSNDFFLIRSATFSRESEASSKSHDIGGSCKHANGGVDQNMVDPAPTTSTTCSLCIIM